MSADNPYRVYPVILSVAEAARLLNDAADVHATGISTINASEAHGGPGVVIEMDAGTTPVTLVHLSEGIRLSEWDYRILSNLSRERRQHYQRHRDKVGADVETLKRYRLPLYWNHGWRVEKYAETGSFNALASTYKREVQGAQGSSILSFDRKFVDGERVVHSVPERRRTRRDRFATYYEDHHDTETQTSMAERFRVTDSTISRWIRELSSIYHELRSDPEVVRYEDELKEFVSKHNIDAEILHSWARKGSAAFEAEPVQQPKATYHSRDEYERLFKEFEELYRQTGGRINQSGIARELNVDRSTVRQWIRRLTEVNAYQPLPG